jgi:hypothetical protein
MINSLYIESIFVEKPWLYIKLDTVWDILMFFVLNIYNTN